MQIELKKQTDGLYVTGLVLLAISFSLYCFSLFNNITGTGFFFVQFSFTGLYFIILLASGRLRKEREGLQPMFVFLLLFLVSAYALNREMVLFQTSVDWLTVLLLLSSANYLLFSVFERLPLPVRYLSCFIGGISLVLFGYFMLYLFPTYIIGLIAFFVLGFSLHVFVPMLLFIYTLVFFGRLKRVSKQYIVYFRAGIILSVTGIIVFVAIWGSKVQSINTALNAGDKHLPSWVSAAQKIKPGFIGNRICKAGLVYDVPHDVLGNLFWGMPARNFGEEMKHDPLVMMASLICGESELAKEDRINILKTLYDSRHHAEERLWSGEDLSTSFVSNNIEVWPQFRIAYSQVKIKVENTGGHSWQNSQEAIYTFHLPEGSVVTSLSLWINGVEENGILTTRSKADNAYKTIVGRESRDPSVVHWQEGNRVSVRVFPVVKGEHREFKIGITSPLLLQDDRLVYQPVYFDGPLATDAKEETQIRFVKKPGNLNMSAAFDESGEYLYTRKGRYNAAWNIAFDKESVAGGSFSFNGKQYKTFTAEPERTTLTVNNVYLDVNAYWSDRECNRVYDLLKQKNVFAVGSNGELQRLTEKNADGVFDALRRNTFSLFPFSKVTDPTSSLVITKSGISSPILDDVKNTSFASDIRMYISKRKQVNVFNIGTKLSPYLQTLKEVRLLNYVQGDITALEEMLTSQRYLSSGEKENEVTLDTSGLTIRQVEGTAESVAPDHLMRLFAYNNILKNHGAAILSGTEYESSAIAEAEQAYVVSPVSSLVVLESQRDYDRFDIKASKDSLKNAALASKGAVPEPHEWVMILIAISLLLYVRRRSFDPSIENQ